MSCCMRLCVILDNSKKTQNQICHTERMRSISKRDFSPAAQNDKGKAIFRPKAQNDKARKGRGLK